MRRILMAMTVCLATRGAYAGEAAQPPFERETWTVPPNGVDGRVLLDLRRKGLSPALPCSDAVFMRRVYLDTIGTLPEPARVAEFLRDERGDKRARLVDELLERDEYVDYWTLRWCDVLRVKAEFPINLWPNAVQAYHHWIRDAVRCNVSYDQFARALLTSSGSNFRVAPVNFYRAVQSREPAGLAEAVALTFMGTRIAAWPQARRDGLAAFFSRVVYKGTDEWKEQIVLCDPGQREAIDAVLPDGTAVTVGEGADPRAVFADWLISADNPWFARCAVNRVWAWLMGRGIVHEPDDFRPDNPPVNPELLDYLSQELVRSNYDIKHVLRLVLNSRTYQQSPIARGKRAPAEAAFACYPMRRLDAEILIDALDEFGGTTEAYESRIPEPFTWIPEEQRTIELADGSITSTFLLMFGRPARDTGLQSERGCDSTDAQRLFMLNSTDVYNRLARSVRLRRIALAAGNDRAQLVRGVYMALLSREPTPGELAAAEHYWERPDVGAHDGETDLAWALVNSMEFLYRH